MNFRGIPDDVKISNPYLLEKVTVTVQYTFEISESVSKVFAKDEAKPYPMEKLRNIGICDSWMCNDRNVVVFASDDENLKEAIEIRKNQFTEAHLILYRPTRQLHNDFGQYPSRGSFSSDVCVRKTDCWKSEQAIQSFSLLA